MKQNKTEKRKQYLRCLMQLSTEAKTIADCPKNSKLYRSSLNSIALIGQTIKGMEYVWSGRNFGEPIIKL